MYTEVSSFQVVGIERSSTVYRGDLISGCWNRGVPLYTEVSSFQVVGIERSSTIYRGDLISGGWNRGVPLYIEVSSFQVVRIERIPLYFAMSYQHLIAYHPPE